MQGTNWFSCFHWSVYYISVLFQRWITKRKARQCRRNALIFISYVFLGCDSTSAFHGKGKVTSLKVLDDYPDLYELFTNLGSSFTPNLTLVNALELFVCLLYKQQTLMRQDSKFSVLENMVQIKCHVQKMH